jgi:hypothetical protein
MKIKNEIYPHKYQPIINQDLFDEVQRVLNSWQKKPFVYKAKPFIFRGLIKCADCGCSITPEAQKGHIYYSCTNYRKMHQKRIYVPEMELLKPIYEVLDGIKLPDKKIKELSGHLQGINKAQSNFFKNVIQNLRQEYDELEAMIDQMASSRSKWHITEEFYLRKINKYSAKQKSILREIDRHDTADYDYHLTINRVLSYAQRAREIFDSSEVKEKRQLLNFLLQNCELKGKNLQYKLKSPFDTLLLAGSCSSMLPLRNTFRTLDWKSIANQLKIFENNNLQIDSKYSLIRL